MIHCKKCGRDIDTVDAKNPLLTEHGICLQCGIDMSLDVSCEVCGNKHHLADLGIYLGHFVCHSCNIGDLVQKVKVKCEFCEKVIPLSDACAYKSKHACRQCGIMLVRERNSAPQGKKSKTSKFFKWFGE